MRAISVSTSPPCLGTGALDADLDYRVLEYAAISTSSVSPRALRCAPAPPRCAPMACFSRRRKQYSRMPGRRRSSLTRRSIRCRRAIRGRFRLDVSALEPQVALPGGVHQAVNLSQAAAGASITRSSLVRLGHVRRHARRGRGAQRPAHRPHVRLFIAPARKHRCRRMAREGLMQIFAEAGAVLLPAGCGPCNDAVIGPVHSAKCRFPPRPTTTSAASARKMRSFI